MKFCPEELTYGFLPLLNQPLKTTFSSAHFSWAGNHQHLSSSRCNRNMKISQRAGRCAVVATNARGFGGFLSNSAPVSNYRDSLPSPEATCACGSEKPYGKCCRRFHTLQSFPQLAEELLRSRYSAYAYRLPSYIMRTTHTSLAELDRRKWKREILDFCRDYRFVGGVDIIEQQMTGPYSTRILFRANLMQRNSAISFLEMATFARERNLWYYKSGKLVDIDDDG